MKKINYSQESLRSLAHELDYELGGINLRRETLNDLKGILGPLRITLDNLRNEDIRLYYGELHTKIRLIDDLLYYTVTNLNEDYKKADEIKNMIFDKVVRKHKKTKLH